MSSEYTNRSYNLNKILTITITIGVAIAVNKGIELISINLKIKESNIETLLSKTLNPNF